MMYNGFEIGQCLRGLDVHILAQREGERTLKESGYTVQLTKLRP